MRSCIFLGKRVRIVEMMLRYNRIEVYFVRIGGCCWWVTTETDDECLSLWMIRSWNCIV
jgi:hypothetical protein